jgi:hypothetical protein
VKRIMRLDKEVRHTSGDACKTIAKATELFIESLVEGSFVAGPRPRRPPPPPALLYPFKGTSGQAAEEDAASVYGTPARYKRTVVMSCKGNLVQ